MNPTKILLFIVAYNAESTIEDVLDRVPSSLKDDNSIEMEILVIDDNSGDNTIENARRFRINNQEWNIKILHNPENLGYGGNQKLGYQYAIKENYEIVALLHGDGQYAPEELPKLLKPLITKQASAVFGSRMLVKGAALEGNMPIYKYIGNKLLTSVQNLLVGTRLSEYHSGYRLYAVAALKDIPFTYNSNGFDFDTDIIIQLHASQKIIEELSIPTFYGDEICHVNGIQYAFRILKTCLQYRLQKYSLYYDPKFIPNKIDYKDNETDSDSPVYRSKFDFTSSHKSALDFVEPGCRVLSLGCGSGSLVEPFVSKGVKLVCVDRNVTPELEKMSEKAISADLNQFSQNQLSDLGKFDQALLLDIIEHLNSPEDFLRDLRRSSILQNRPILITTPNIAFFAMRLSLLFGQFNYGPSGILDKTHTRLFTFRSLKRLLVQSGYKIDTVYGIPAPFPLALGRESRLGWFLLRFNSLLVKVWKSMFSFQIAIVARPQYTVNQLLHKAVDKSEK